MDETYTARVGLHVDAPDGGIEIERFESALLAESLELVDMLSSERKSSDREQANECGGADLVTTIVTRARKTLGVLVGEDRAVGLHRRQTGQVLREMSERVIIGLDASYL